MRRSRTEVLALLLDTQVIIWIYNDDQRLSSRVRDRIVTGEDMFVSFASAWEYNQKRLLKPAVLPVPLTTLLGTFPHIQLPCTIAVADYAETLPLIHRDPFDRMLIAQAIHHKLTLVTSDTTIHRYPVDTFW